MRAAENGLSPELKWARPASVRLWQSPHLALAIAALLWSGNFIVGRAFRGEISPVNLNFMRWLVALAVFAPFVARDMLAVRRALVREWRLILSLAATGIAGFHTIVYAALLQTTAIKALLALSLAPGAILAGAALTGAARLKMTEVIGTVVAVIGAGILIVEGDISLLTRMQFNMGDMLMIAAVAVWAIYSLLLRRRPADLSAPVVLAGSMAAALALLAPLAAWEVAANGVPRITRELVLAIGYVAVAASVLGFACWSYGVSAVGPERAGQFVNLMPVFGTMLSVVLLGETLHAAEAFGGALILGGLLFTMASRR